MKLPDFSRNNPGNSEKEKAEKNSFPLLEKELKQKLEKELRLKMQEEIQRLAEEKLSQERRDFQAQKENFQKEIRSLSAQVEEFKQGGPSAPKPNISVQPPPSAARNVDASQNPFSLSDPSSEQQMRLLYKSLHDAGVRVFESLNSTGRPAGLEQLAAVVAEVRDYLSKGKGDLLWLVVEPYAEIDHFAYHCTNCCVLAISLGIDLKLDAEELLDLGMAAFLLDVGLLKVRDNLDYPKQLSAEIKQEVLQHTDCGAEMLKDHVNENILKGIRQHHETANGKGYPQGIEGKDIHIFARVIQCVDSFEALTHYRPYRKIPLDVSAAIKEMIEVGRGVYDRDVLKALMNQVGLYPVMTLVELSNKQVARVIRQNKKFPLSPLVRVEFDEQGRKIKDPQPLDLTKNQLIHIVRLLGGTTGTPSYTKEKLDQKKKKKAERKRMSFAFLREAFSFLIMAFILLALIYIVVKV